MDLREKLMDAIVYTENHSKTVNELETICDEFAIGFYEWRSTSLLKNIDQYTNKELLQIYKDENSILSTPGN